MSRQLDSLRAFVGDRTGGAFRHVPNAVVLASGKGGVGVSTASVLVAIGAMRAGRSALLVDAGTGTASIDAILGASADADQPEGVRQIAPRLALAAVPSPHDLPVGERRAALRRLSAEYRAHELVVIDAGATCDGVSAAISAGAGRLVAVTRVDRLSITATYALLKFVLERFPSLPVSVLVNRAEPADATAVFGHVADAVEGFLAATVSPAGSLPDDDTLFAATDAGLSPETADGPAVQAARLLAELLIHAGSGRHGRPGTMYART